MIYAIALALTVVATIALVMGTLYVISRRVVQLAVPPERQVIRWELHSPILLRVGHRIEATGKRLTIITDARNLIVAEPLGEQVEYTLEVAGVDSETVPGAVLLRVHVAERAPS